MHGMATRSTFPLVDRLCNENLAEWLAEWRANGLSFETIADRLNAESGVTVSASTIRRWCETELAA